MEDQITTNRLIRKNKKEHWNRWAITKLLKYYLERMPYNDEKAVVLEKILVFNEDKELKEKIEDILYFFSEDVKAAINDLCFEYADIINYQILKDLEKLEWKSLSWEIRGGLPIS